MGSSRGRSATGCARYGCNFAPATFLQAPAVMCAIFTTFRVGQFCMSESQIRVNTIVIPFSVHVFCIFCTFHTLLGGAGPVLYPYFHTLIVCASYIHLWIWQTLTLYKVSSSQKWHLACAEKLDCSFFTGALLEVPCSQNL